MTPPLAFLEDELAALAAEGRLRVPVDLPPSTEVLCSNDYLGLGDMPLPATDAPAGAGASRLVSGDHRTHRAAEEALAAWVGLDDALLFTSGYAANVGTLSALAQPGDRVVSDALNHASIIDGCRLSRAAVEVVPHRDLDAVARALAAPCEGRRWVVTESYFSMDGTASDLPALRALCDRAGAALVVDEAHALGVFGPEGAGRCRQLEVRPDVLVGTLGKSVGLSGAFVAGPPTLRRVLWNRARSFVFSTGVSPALASAIPPRVQLVREADEARERLTQLGETLRRRLVLGEGELRPSIGPIVPWWIGDDTRALAIRDALLDEGLFVQAIRPPTVPEGTARLRITLRATLTDATIDRLLAAAVRAVAPPS